MTHWTILGAGSLGTLWACYLIQNYPVNLISRQEISSPVTLSAQGKDCSFNIPNETAKQLSQDIDHLLLCTKAYDALPALLSIVQRLNSQSKILLIQNGMGSQEAIVNAFPDLAIYAASCTEGAYKSSPDRVVHAGQGQTLYGPLTAAARQHDLDLNSALKVTHCQKIQPVLLHKLAINCAINGLTCIYECKNGELLDSAERQNHLQQLCDEIQQVIGEQLESIDIYKSACQIATTTANNISSMRQDILNKKPTEIDYINGYLQTVANLNNIEIQTNLQLIQDIKKLESSYC